MDTHVLGVGSLVAGRYRIVRELGRGAMGVVYVAEHLNTGGLWALKVMVDGSRFSEERARRFRREARASARIVSEHVVKVTDADVAPELGNAPFLVMELLEGEDLERTIEKTGALEPKAAVDILKQMARGLDKAHAAGVIHRDLKPENVFLHRRDDGSTIVKVLDFGISKILQSDRDIMNISLSSTTDVMGTPLYMAPEQAMAKNADVSPATDVWALGLMTVRLLTNEVYWTGQSIPEIFVQIMTPQRDPPSQRWPQLGPEFDAWFAKSTALDPKQRFQSVREQIDALAMVLLGERAAVGPSVTPQGASDAPAVPAVSLAPQLSQSPQLRTQRIPNPFNDDGPSINAVAGTIEPVGASADDHVQRVALPMSKARPIAIVAAAIAMVGIAIFGFTFLRSPKAEVSQSAGTSASQPPASPSGASLPPAAAPTDTAPAPPPVASAVASANEPAPPVQKAAAAPTIAHGNGGNARGAALAPARTTAAVTAAAAPAAPVPAASSAAVPAKPPAHQDLFDTQK